ncbi:divalent-cation tolerance protein CutA [Amorphus orientalis]|uniref:Periplasmic divalent cation tolerance protein n=1 Tax=Amorphus orientalis TaxID=649198 RepID=A0AAE3VPC1_9HYPH|nr:divalent-cation tolerance protein CutA [Amorphus orientalis]MDQ0315814.1 periplasmic divalent cation tolerance protein [Amorphus orientalis]
MDDSDLTLIYTTFPDVESARRVGGDLVTDGLAACTNILPGMISVFAWEGKIEQENEVAMIVKTRRALIDAVTRAVVDKHPYDEPAVVALPVTGGSKSFLDWIRSSTAAA